MGAKERERDVSIHPGILKGQHGGGVFSLQQFHGLSRSTCNKFTAAISAPRNSECFSIICIIIFEVNTVIEGKQAYDCSIKIY